MVQLAGFYDENAEPSADFGPIPAGEYEAEIVDSNLENLKDNKGRCLVLVWKVVNGDYSGRQVWQRLNLWFSGPEKTPGKVVQIANSQFASIREATGVRTPADTVELYGIPCLLRVDYVEQQGYKPKNEVAAVKPRGSVGPSFRAAAAAPSAPKSPVTGPAQTHPAGTRPWGKSQPATT